MCQEYIEHLKYSFSLILPTIILLLQVSYREVRQLSPNQVRISLQVVWLQSHNSRHPLYLE